MNIPAPGVIRNPGSNLYETLYQPFDGPLDFLTPDVELPKHVEIWPDRHYEGTPGVLDDNSDSLYGCPAKKVSGVRLRRNYPIKAKKSSSIREVREVRDDKATCYLIQLSQDKKSGSGATPTTRMVQKGVGVPPD